jgi:hypothetical protein
MDLSVHDQLDLIGLGTKLLHRACGEITGYDAMIANVWKGEPYPVYFRLEEKPSPYGNDPTVQVLYSNTSLAFCESAPPDEPPSFPGPLTFALFGLLLLAALQPTGKILGRDASTPWIIRCFPILYVADALAVLMSWMHLVLVSGNGIRHAASAVFEARNSGEEMEYWTFSLAKAKAATPARWAAFGFGVGFPLLDTFDGDAGVQVKVLLSVYAVAWLVFEVLLLVAKIDADEDKTDSVEPTAPDTASDSDSLVLVETPAPPNKALAGEQEKKPIQLSIPTESESEPKPNTTPIIPEDNHPSTSSATRESSQVLRYFATAAILVSAVYHIVPLVFSEAAVWYGYVAGWYLAEPVDRPGSSPFQLADAALSAFFWIIIAAQDLLVGEWLPTIGEREHTENLPVTWQVVPGLVWVSGQVVYLLVGEDSESEYGEALWLAVLAGSLVAMNWAGGRRGSIEVAVVDLFRIYVVFSAMMFYSQVIEDETPAVATGIVCQMGRLCRRCY